VQDQNTQPKKPPTKTKNLTDKSIEEMGMFYFENIAVNWEIIRA